MTRDELTAWADACTAYAQACYAAAVDDHGVGAVVHLNVRRKGARLPSYATVFPAPAGHFVLAVHIGPQLVFRHLPIPGPDAVLPRVRSLYRSPASRN